MNKAVDYSLYLVTDRELMSTNTLDAAVEAAIRGGCTMIQLREKDLDSRAFCAQASSLRVLTRQTGVPLIINDRVDIALASNADGVHVGQSDLPAAVVRQIIGPDKLLGVSASTLEEAAAAEQGGADYLGIGAMYPTGTKSDAAIVSIEELCAIRKAVSIPIVVIGGINEQTLPAFAGTGIDGLAVVSAVIAQPDIEAAARQLLQLFRQLR